MEQFKEIADCFSLEKYLQNPTREVVTTDGLKVEIGNPDGSYEGCFVALVHYKDRPRHEFFDLNGISDSRCCGNLIFKQVYPVKSIVSFKLKNFLKNPEQKVITRDGRPARIICTNLNNDYPIVACVENKYNKKEYVYKYSTNGRLENTKSIVIDDLIFE